MTQIKFQGWDNEDKIMWQPISLEELLCGGWELQSVDEEHSLPYKDYLNFCHDDTIWRRFTGLTDKNGKEIYEGDLIDYGNGRYMPVEFIDGCFCICKNTAISTLMTLFPIIGNIYENPELLNP